MALTGCRQIETALGAGHNGGDRPCADLCPACCNNRGKASKKSENAATICSFGLYCRFRETLLLFGSICSSTDAAAMPNAFVNGVFTISALPKRQSLKRAPKWKVISGSLWRRWRRHTLSRRRAARSLPRPRSEAQRNARRCFAYIACWCQENPCRWRCSGSALRA